MYASSLSARGANEISLMIHYNLTPFSRKLHRLWLVFMCPFFEGGMLCVGLLMFQTRSLNT